MALRGNLKDFSLPDVFQLVTFSRKTGVLRINRADGADGSVWFRDGDVFFASSNWHKEMLGERLVKAQRITPQALQRALEVRSGEPADGRRLGQILIDEGYITDKVLEAFVTEQIQDTIFDLMRWDEGEFDFLAMPEAIDEDIGLTVSIENVVMEGSRRLEEWTRIKKKIPSMDVIFKMATAPGEGTFEISLKPLEWQLLLLVDGTRSVADLGVDTRRTDFDVARVLYGLFSAGLLEFATEEEIEHNRAERAEREAKLSEILASSRAADDAATAAALERESKLAAEAQQRLASGSTAIPAAQAQPAAAEPRTEPVEEPEFLGGARVAPTADDAAVLEEFMGAVLQKPPVEPAAPAVEPEQPVEVVSAPQPHVPVEEPAFMSAGATAEEEMPVMPVTSVEDLLGIEIPAAQPEPEQIPEPEEQPAEERDFERDLLAMGLGEAPVEVVVPETAPAVTLPPAEETGEQVVEPMSMLGDEMASLVTDMGLPTEIPGEAAPEEVEAAATPDFSDLLQSLDVDAEVAETSPVDAGFDADLLREEQEASAGVISTDAFMGDISVDDMGLGFSGGLTDELSALTGAERKQPRPQASVNQIPESGSSVIQRDARVDKDTLLKIIEGIKGL
jgi:hypothetical protein